MKIPRTPKLLLHYFRQVAEVWRQRPGAFRQGRYLRYLLPWLRSQLPGHSSMRDESPWICFQAREFLERYLRPDMVVFEYGAGGSTLFFARRVAEVHSVEHHPEWFEAVRKTTQSRFPNCRPILAAPVPGGPGFGEDIAGPHGCASSDAHYRGMDFRGYVHAIERFPEGSLDVVVVDGRARPSCVEAARHRVRPGGLLVFDNSEQPHYVKALQTPALATWERWDFFGPLPYVPHFSCTTIWRRPASQQPLSRQPAADAGERR